MKKCIIKHSIQNFSGALQHEQKISKILQKKLDDLKSPTSGILLSYDFYLEKYNILIEVQGKQHYEKTNF